MTINIPKRVTDRIKKSSKKFTKIINSAYKADINESDTVLIVRDMLEEIFGYDRYAEITTEYVVRGVFCDVAIKIDNELRYLIEVKNIGTDLKENHLRQAMEYSTKANLDWVILTNGRVWNTYKITYKRPIQIEQIFEINWLEENLKDESFIERIFCLCKEGITKTALRQYEEEKQATSRYIIGSIIIGDNVLKVIRREIKKLSNFNVDIDNLRSIVIEDVLKREVVEGDEASVANKRYKAMLSKESRKNG